MIPREFWPELWVDLREKEGELEAIIIQNQKEIEEKNNRKKEARGAEFDKAIYRQLRKADRERGLNHREKRKNKPNL